MNNCNYNNARGDEVDFYYIEDSGSSANGDEINYSSSKHSKPAKLDAESSPPLVLIFPNSGKVHHDTCQTFSDDSDQSIEDWMIVDEKELEGDSNIQLNLTYWSSSEDDFGKTDKTNETTESMTDSWIVSDKDKNYIEKSPASRYFAPGRSLFCHICNKMGHVARSCYRYKKCPICILCGIRGHIHRDCPTRPCPNCGFPPHGFDLCKVPPVWNQLCQRCGMTGHLSDVCPDRWRQYHLTISSEVPLKPKSVCHVQHRRLRVHCFNCSKRGHYGHECTWRRMVSGTFSSLPYVCHYDTFEDILQHRTKMQEGANEVIHFGVLPLFDQEQSCERAGEGKEKFLVQRRSRTKQVANSQAGRRRTWPERRKVRRQVKRLRKEAQAMRDQRLLGRSCLSSDHNICPGDLPRNFVRDHNQVKFPSNKKRTDEIAGRKIWKNKEVKKWKKKRGITCGNLHPYGNIDVKNENFLSPEQRVHLRKT